MYMTMPVTVSIVKVTKPKSEPFKYALSMVKCPAVSVHIGNIIHYLIYIPDPFPSSLEVDLKGSSTFPILMLLIHIDTSGLFYHL